MKVLVYLFSALVVALPLSAPVQAAHSRRVSNEPSVNHGSTTFKEPIAYARTSATPSGDLTKAVDNALYEIKPNHGVFQADNPAQRLNAEFVGPSTNIRTRSGTLELRLLGYGSPHEVRVDGKRLERRYRGLREWFVNDGTGLEQGFVVEKKPPKLVIEMAAKGDWKTIAENNKLTFTSGDAKLEYSGLKAWDARGTALEAQMQTVASGFEITVMDTHAVYPVTVDPVFAQAAVLTDPNALSFGYSSALSSDGNTALVGAVFTTVNGNVGQGAAYVFTRSGGSWTEQAELTAPSSGADAGAANDAFGVSVSLSADGTIAAVGAINKLVGTQRTGAVYLFALSGNTWGETNLLADSVTDEGYGVSVKLSGDGKTVLVGATEVGKVYIYGPIPTSIGFILGFQASFQSFEPFSNFGFSLALTSDGSTALVGSDGFGAVYAYQRSGTSWTQQQVIGGQVPGGFGFSLSLSPDGTVLLIGADEEGSDAQGAAYIYANNNGTWAQQARLSAPTTVSTGSAAPLDHFGYSVALSSDGTKALIGAPEKTIGGVASAGAAYVFFGGGSSWSLEQTIVDPGGTQQDLFGWSAALSSDGATALIGADQNTAQGHAYVFSGVNITITSTPSGLQFTSGDDSGCAPGTYTTPVTLQWVPSAACTVTFATPQTGLLPVPPGVQYVFTSWEDGSTDASRFIVAPLENTTYTATFKTQFQLTTQASPANGGSVTPPTGFFDAGSTITIIASSHPLYVFTGFSGALTGSADPQAIVLNSPVSVTANFETIFQVIAGVSNLVANYVATGSIDNSGVAQALNSKLSAAQAQISAGDNQAAVNVLGAMVHQLNAQTGKHITASAATVLITDTEAVQASLSH